MKAWNEQIINCLRKNIASVTTQKENDPSQQQPCLKVFIGFILTLLLLI